MLNSTLSLLEELLPSNVAHVDQATWEKVSPQFCDELAAIAEKLLSTVSLTFPKRLRTESKEEYLRTTTPAIKVAEYRLRPETAYYSQMHRTVPLPENRHGYSATGIEISFVLCRGFPNGKAIRRPVLSIDLQVWGEYERLRFGELLRDHRYFLEQLLKDSPATFFTSCVFENVEQAKRANTFQKLALYYENSEDDENMFSLQNEFSANATEAEVVRALLPMIALYDSAMGYCLPRKRRDRILEYLALVER